MHMERFPHAFGYIVGVICQVSTNIWPQCSFRDFFQKIRKYKNGTGVNLIQPTNHVIYIFISLMLFNDQSNGDSRLYAAKLKHWRLSSTISFGTERGKLLFLTHAPPVPVAKQEVRKYLQLWQRQHKPENGCHFTTKVRFCKVNLG